MTTKEAFRGIGAALLTAMNEDLSIDAAKTADIAKRLVARGVLGAVLVGGTTGEALTLTADERAEVLQAVIGAVGNEVLVVAGVGASSLSECLDIAETAIEIGASNILSPPAPDVEVLEHYEAMAGAVGDTPLIAYHLPEFYNPVPFELVGSLPIQGIKDSCGEPSRLWRELATYGDQMNIYTGTPHILHTLGQAGGAGGIVGIASIYPELTVRAFGDAHAQVELTVAEGNLWHADHAPFPQNLKVLAATVFDDLPVYTRPTPRREQHTDPANASAV